MARYSAAGRILPFLLAVLVTAGCTKGFGSEAFQKTEEIGLNIRGKEVLKSGEDRLQVGFREVGNEFWVTDDNMANYFIIRCNRFPVTGSTVKADLIYTTQTNIRYKDGVFFKVVKVDDSSGKVWLWSERSKISAIVRYLR